MIRYCKQLRSLCVTMGTRQDFIGMLRLLADEDSLPELRDLGIRSPRGVDGSALEFFKASRPHVKVRIILSFPIEETCVYRLNNIPYCSRRRM